MTLASSVIKQVSHHTLSFKMFSLNSNLELTSIRLMISSAMPSHYHTHFL